MISEPVETQEVAILVHGFNNNQTDMYYLRDQLNRLGYAALTVNLPLRFRPLEECVAVFSDQIQPILAGCAGYTKIHLVGYSMGGLVVRAFLADNRINKLGRCVLIATPNRGTRLAGWANSFLRPMVHIYKPLKSLQPGFFECGEPNNVPKPEIGVIAGAANKHLLGLLLTGANDGRIEIESALDCDMTDYVIRPYGHKEIHHQPDTAHLVHCFLGTGSFPK